MNKTDILAYITARWGDITSPKRLPIKDREVSSSLINELYPTITTETQSSNTITQESSSTKEYTLNIRKSGSEVTMYGRIKNNTGSSISISTILTIVGADYIPYDFTKVYGFSDSDNRPIKFNLVDGVLTVISPIANGETININFKYFTE